MKVIVFGYNSLLGHPNAMDVKAEILKQLKDNTGLLVIDGRLELKGIIELSEKDCKQFGVVIGKIGERENH